MSKGKGGKGKGNLSEASRTAIWDRILAFKHSHDDVETLEFSSALSNAERAQVHRASRDLGLKSKSNGVGDSRSVTVSKKGVTCTGAGDANGEADQKHQAQPSDNAFPFKLSNASCAVLFDYLHSDMKMEWPMSTGQAKQRSHGRKRWLGPAKKPFDADRRNEELWQKRSELPVWSDDVVPKILQACRDEKHRVFVVCGSTGSGKSTQIPQMLLQEIAGTDMRIVCSQPRRVAAISVAERISEERSESIGSTVGYQVRLESKRSDETRLLFVTTGLLLRILQSDRMLSGVGCVVVDEVHERDRDTDFMLIILKDLLKQRKDLRVILMSATVNHKVFSEYFGNCPVIHIPGKLHPVHELFLEDVIEATGYEIPVPLEDVVDQVRWWDENAHSEYTANKQRNGAEAEEDPTAAGLTSKISSDLIGQYSESTIASLKRLDETRIDFELIRVILGHVFAQSYESDGAALVFLPGWNEIAAMASVLEDDPIFGDPARFQVLLLHSSIPPKEQRRVFMRPKKPMRKIVLSTNIAETSLTIDDVVYVIDSGKVKEHSFDPISNMSGLDCSWVSKDSAKQRAGRAGRVRSGYVYRLFSRRRFEQFDQHQTPELLRTPLEEVCLKVKQLALGDITSFLARAVNAPPSLAVERAIQCLLRIGALDDNQDLTVLGRHLVHLPIHPRLSKMLLYAVTCRCITPILAIVCACSFSDLFSLSLTGREQVDSTKRTFSAGSFSDMIMYARVFSQWQTSLKRGNAARFCDQHLLSHRSMLWIRSSMSQLMGILVELGLVSNDAGSNAHIRVLDEHSDNLEIVKAVLCAGMYPHVARVDKKGKLSTEHERRAMAHPGSVNSRLRKCPGDFLLFFEKIKSKGVLLRHTTNVQTLSLILFAGASLEIDTADSDNTRGFVIIDEWLKFALPQDQATMLIQVRNHLDAMMCSRIEHPSRAMTPQDRICMDVVAHLLALETRFPKELVYSQGLPSAARPRGHRGRGYSGRGRGRGRGRGQ